MPEIMGYSERGLVNALFESILASADPTAVLTRLLQTATLVENRHSVVKYRLRSPIRDFKVFIEPSLSQFGNPDVVLLLDREPIPGEGTPAEDAGEYSDVIFIEAKIEGFAQSVERSPVLHKNASTVLHELFLKARFTHYLLRDEERIHSGVPVYADDMKDPAKPYARKVGSDPVVLDLVEQIRGCNPWFFALTTDRGHPASPHEGSFLTGNVIGELQRKIRAANEVADPSITEGWVGGWWEELTYLWSWHDMLAEAQDLVASGEPAMQRLLETMEWNRPKFTFPTVHDDVLDRLLGEFTSREDLEEGDRKSPDRKTFYKGGRARFTCRIADSFEGPVLETNLLSPEGKRRKVKVPSKDIEQHTRGGSATAAIDELLGSRRMP